MKREHLIEALEGVESINIFVDDAYNNALRVAKYFSDILKEKEKIDIFLPNSMSQVMMMIFLVHRI